MATSERGFSAYLDQVSGIVRAVHIVMTAVSATLGIFILTIGVTGVFDKYKEFNGISVSVTAIVLGILVTWISLIGIVGSIKRSQHMFAAFSGLLSLLVLVQLVALLVIMLKPTDVEARFGSVWESTYENNPDELKSIEKDLKCCGFKSPVDMAVPAHCAVKKHYGFSTGCLELLEQQWHGQRSTVVWVGVAMVGAQIVSLLLGAELGRRYRSTSTEPRRNEGSPLLRA